MENQESSSDENVKSNIPRAWGLTLILLMFLIIPQAAMEFVYESPDLRRSSIILHITMILVGLLIMFFVINYAWELWTKNGKYGLFSVKDTFSVDGKSCGKTHIFFWWFVSLLLMLAAFGAIKEAMSKIA